MANNTTKEADQAAFDWRTVLPVHAAADAYPKVTHERLVEIGESIRRSGLEFPILMNAKGDPGNPEAFELFDGVTRLNSMVAVGIKFEFERFCFTRDTRRHGEYSLRLVIHGVPDNPDSPSTTKIFHNLSDAEIADKIEIANLHRRHLEPEQYRARIEASHARIKAALERDSEKSNYLIGEETGTSEAAVRRVRTSTASPDAVDGKRVGKDGKARKQPKPGGSPGFDAARERAKRLGREVEQLASRGFKLTSPDGGPGVCFHSLKRLNERLKEIEEEKAGADADASTGEAIKAAHAAAEAKANTDDDMPPTEAVIALHNILAFETTIPAEIDMKALAALVREGEAAISESGSAVSEINRVRRVLDFARRLSEALDDTPSDPGPSGGKIESAADAIERLNNTRATIDEMIDHIKTVIEPEETEEKPTPEAPAQAGTVSAVEEQKAPAPDPSLDIPGFLIRAHDAPVPIAPIPLTPPSPSSATPPLSWEDKPGSSFGEHPAYKARTAAGEYAVRPYFILGEEKLAGYSVNYYWPDPSGDREIEIDGKKIKLALEQIATARTAEKAKAAAQKHYEAGSPHGKAREPISGERIKSNLRAAKSTPAPTSSSPTTPRARSTYRPGTENDPRWKQLSADELEARIRSVKGKRYPRQSGHLKRRLDHIEEMEERLDVLRKADRAAARVVAAGSAAQA